MVIVGSTDRAGQVWASVLAGGPGFAHAVGVRAVRIRAVPAPGDPLAAILGGAEDPPAPLELGLLIIDLETRDRMRLNGPAEVEPDGAILVHAREVYFNCPKYIQAREVSAADSAGRGRRAAEVTRAEVLSAATARVDRGGGYLFHRQRRTGRGCGRLAPRRQSGLRPRAGREHLGVARLLGQHHVQHPGQHHGRSQRRPVVPGF